MKLSRLWQPGRLLFWQWVTFNLLSSVCTWALHTLPLNDIGVLLVGGVALLNVGFGLLAAWALVASTAAVVWILYRREFHSDVLAVLADDPAA